MSKTRYIAKELPWTKDDEALMRDFVGSPFYPAFKKGIENRRAMLNGQLLTNKDFKYAERMEELEDMLVEFDNLLIPVEQLKEKEMDRPIRLADYQP